MSMCLPGSLQKLFRDFPHILFQDYPLRGKNTWGVGGKAVLACFPERHEQVVSLAQELDLLEGFPYAVLGGGSNVLISDKGFSGCVIFTEKLDRVFILPEISSREPEEIMVYVDSGVSLGRLLRFCREHFLGGLEFSVGIPGSIGGALVGNAGAQGEAIGNVVRYVDVLLPNAVLQRIPASDIVWGYRFSSLSRKQCMILGCALGLCQKSSDTLEKNISFFAEKRKAQPVLRKTAGSVFKNPCGGYAGKLLELSGCKGKKIGGARVSVKHANFIENYNEASGQDILDLIFLCRKMVAEHTGTILYPEVRFVGFESSEILFY